MPDREPDGASVISELLRAWDVQQAAYIAERELRFGVMLDVLEMSLGHDDVLVLDLACGPGSLGVRVLERFKRARVIAIDLDPVLLRLAEQALAGYDGRARIGEADLAEATWVDALHGETPHAVVSSTALHWLSAPALVGLYATLGDLLPAGAIFLNGDHQPFDGRSSTMRELAKRHDEATQADAFAQGADTWGEWWDRVAAVPELTVGKALRDERFAPRHPTPPTTVEFHVAALQYAGFTEVGTLWQLFDDYVVFGRR